MVKYEACGAYKKALFWEISQGLSCPLPVSMPPMVTGMRRG